MEKIDFKEMQKKDLRIGIRLSAYEKEKLDDFCYSHNVTISDVIRHSLKKILKTGK
jgi:antitoxin component of RelBE/YafQ-DinJ toxin-antitoxin module